jgi:hypothetical protein
VSVSLLRNDTVSKYEVQIVKMMCSDDKYMAGCVKVAPRKQYEFLDLRMECQLVRVSAPQSELVSTDLAVRCVQV